MDQIQLLTAWISFLAAGALLIRVGQVLSAVGTARSKNAASAAARNLSELSITVLGFLLFGIYLMTFRTSAGLLGIGGTIPVGFSAVALQFTAMVLIATGLIAPAVAGRSRLMAPLVCSSFFALILFPLLGRWVWFGWLAHAGFIDVAGAAPVHLAGALCAAVACWWVGPRDGKYNHDGSTNMIPAHQASLPAIGTLLMLAGWLPYVMGCALVRESNAAAMDGGVSAMAGAAINALIAAAAGGVGAMIILRLRYWQDDLTSLGAGIVSGAVAMTAACGMISSWQAAVLGFVAGLLTPVGMQWLDFKFRLDDPGCVIVPHGVGALVALLGVAAFSQQNIAGRLHALGAQCLGIGAIAVITIGLSWLTFAVLSRVMRLRVKEADEFDGLDLAQHDVNAYPDFQQTTIKSYHLREA